MGPGASTAPAARPAIACVRVVGIQASRAARLIRTGVEALQELCELAPVRWLDHALQNVEQRAKKLVAPHPRSPAPVRPGRSQAVFLLVQFAFRHQLPQSLSPPLQAVLLFVKQAVPDQLMNSLPPLAPSLRTQTLRPMRYIIVLTRRIHAALNRRRCRLRC